MHLLLAILLLSLPLAAREVRISWDSAQTHEAVTSWKIWRGIELLATAITPTYTLTIPEASTTITITAHNATGASPHSAPLTIPPMMWI